MTYSSASSWGPVPLDGSFPHRPAGPQNVVRIRTRPPGLVAWVAHCQVCGRKLVAAKGPRRLYWRHAPRR